MVLEQFEMNKIFVIIVTYKGRQWYDRCFSSLRESTIPVQTVVVDNASNDGTVEYIRENYPEIHLIESKENLGFGRANNIAMRYTLENGCDYVFLLNQDTWIEPDSIEKLVEVHGKYPQYGILSPLHLTADGKSLGMLIDDGNNPYRKNLEMVGDLCIGTIKDVYPVVYVNAAAWLLPRKTLETVGGFNPIFFHFAEDDDYLKRARYHGLGIGVCLQSRIIHDHSNLFATLQVSKTRIRQYQVLAARFSDPISNESISRYRRYLLRKVIVFYIKGNKSAAKKMWDDFRYLGKNQKNIENNREENKKTQSSWLYQ